MRHTSDRPAAPDYTAACIVLFGVNLMWVLFAIWVAWGLLAVVLAGWGVNWLIARVEIARR